MATFKKISNAILAVFFDMLTRGTYRSLVRQENNQRRRNETLMATLAYDCVKEILSPNGQERLRIIRDGESYGAVMDVSESSEKGWVPTYIMGPGCVYDSVESAVTAAIAAIGWPKAKAGI